MTYSYETAKFTFYLALLIVAFTAGGMMATRGIVGVLWTKHGEPVKSSLILFCGAILIVLTVLAGNVFSINNFDIVEFQQMLEPTGYLVGKNLPSDYSSPIPVETVDGEKCFFSGGVKALLPKQTFVFTPQGCGDAPGN